MPLRDYTKSNLRTLATQGLGAALAAPRKRKNDEWRLQYETFLWWRSEPRGVPHHLFFHVPNGTVLGGTKWERGVRARMLKLTGMENGVADCFLSVPRGVWHGFYIEFKTPTGVVSEDQKVFLASAAKQGYLTAVVRTLEDAKKMITDYMTCPSS